FGSHGTLRPRVAFRSDCPLRTRVALGSHRTLRPRIAFRPCRSDRTEAVIEERDVEYRWNAAPRARVEFDLCRHPDARPDHNAEVLHGSSAALARTRVHAIDPGADGVGDVDDEVAARFRGLSGCVVGRPRLLRPADRC